MDNKVSVLLVGLGRYGARYVDSALNNSDKMKLVGVVDPSPMAAEETEKLKENGIVLYKSMEEFYSNSSADLCVISTPIHFHTEQTIYALQHGSNVLCEKPAAGCVDDVQKIIDVQGETDKLVAIGFQQSFDDNILKLKKDIISGVWGKPKLFKSINLLPRAISYFKSRSWSGEIMSADGRMINDSIANNACAHTLHILLFLLGEELASSDMPQSTDVRLYNANKLKTFDSIAMDIRTNKNIPILYYASHAVDKSYYREFELHFENGIVKYSENDKTFIGKFNNGEIKDYGWNDDFDTKLLKCVNAVNGKRDLITCSAETALAHAKAIDMIMEDLPQAYIFDEAQLKTFKRGENPYIYVSGMYEVMVKAYNENTLPSSAWNY